MENKKIGLFAGKGRIPLVLAQSMQEKGLDIIAISIDKTNENELKKYCYKVFDISPTQLGKIISTYKNESVNELVMVGKVEKSLLYHNLKFDLRSIKLLATLKDRQDSTILSAIVKELAKDNITVLPQTTFLSHLLFQPSVLTKKKPGEREYQDIKFGLKIVETIAELDISQTVVVKNKAIMSIEAIEGTTEAIKRGTSLSKEAVVVKTSKISQDPRFDIATVGIETIKAMAEGKASCLAIKAGRTFLVDKDEVVKIADGAGISIVVME